MGAGLGGRVSDWMGAGVPVTAESAVDGKADEIALGTDVRTVVEWRLLL
jgi:hypothetical protein